MLAASAAFGVTFGLLDVAFPAFARGHSASAAAGILLSAFAAGSLAGGLLYGSRPWPGTAARRYPPLCLLATVGLAPLLLTPGLVLMAGLSVLAGLCFAPIGISQVAVIDEVTPAGHRAEAFTWLGAIYGGGLALGAAVAGQLVQRLGRARGAGARGRNRRAGDAHCGRGNAAAGSGEPRMMRTRARPSSRIARAVPVLMP